MALQNKLLLSVGLAWTSVAAVKALNFIYTYIRPSSISHYYHKHPTTNSPPWALITGSSDGIGKGYANELASRGFNIILHGRNATKLEAVRDSLQTQYPNLNFRILVLDASRNDPEAIKAIQDAVDSIKDLHITILVNNVGGGSKPSGVVMEPFTKYTAADISHLMNVNAYFAAQITHAVLPLLLSHGKPALILTMGSMSDFGMPYLSVYSASKKFDLTFSTALKRELKAEHPQVEVLGIMTGGVTDVAWDKSQSSFTRPKSGQLARAAIARVGCGEEVVAAWAPHALLWAMPSLLPGWLFDMVVVKTSQEEMKKWGVPKKKV